MGTHIYVYDKRGKERVDLPWPKVSPSFGPEYGKKPERLDREAALRVLAEILTDPWQLRFVGHGSEEEDWLVEALAKLELAVLADDFGWMKIA